MENRQEPVGSVVENDASNLRKRPRRRTFYIPPEETTVLEARTGIQSDRLPPKNCSLQAEHNEEAKLLAQEGKKTRYAFVRSASLAAAPKRISLQPTPKPLQVMDYRHDSFAAGYGKENVSPECPAASMRAHRPDPRRKPRRDMTFHSILKHSSEHIKPYSVRSCCVGHDLQKAPVQVNGSESRRRLSRVRKPPKPALDCDRRASMPKKRDSLSYQSDWKAISNAEICEEQVALPNKPIAAPVLRTKICAKPHYQMLEDDIEKPEMYEDAWLNDQESVIQQLLNDLFEEAHHKTLSHQCNQQNLKRQLLHLYDDLDCTLTRKRLHASLLYGALNPAKSSIADINRLKSDIGLRQNFLAIWLDTYDLHALVPALEVVVGRNVSPCFSPPKSSLRRNYEGPIRERKRNVGHFIKSCLLQNEDAQEQKDQSNSLWSWRRTMLRCLMTVLLLDKAKEGRLLPKELFQSSSNVKSSADIVTGLLSLIAPFLGVGTRLLAHLQYEVHHRQSPFSEIKYGVGNLATDLRDGIQLTHLIEFLLYPPQDLTGIRKDIVVELPSGEVLRSFRDEQTLWPLSQHLHIPCLTQTQKAYNVQIALSALRGVGGVLENVAEGIRAEDIVTGHREKTVALLWSLVGTYGLEALVDLKDVQGEICRLSKQAIDRNGHEPELEVEPEAALKGMAKHAYLLKQWAIASAGRQGLQVSNLTTSFSDGRVFAAIVGEYQKYIPKGHTASLQGAGELEVRLKDIGCSKTFGKTTCCGRRSS